MYNVGADWNPKQQKLREFLSKSDNFEEAIQICLELHSVVHTSLVSAGITTYMDEIWDGLNREIFSTALDSKNGFGRKATIAWDIWHITRIEDLTTNILIADRKQVLDKGWIERLGIMVTETSLATVRLRCLL